MRDHLRVTEDPVLEQRRRIARLVATGQRIGYSLFGLAVVLFIAALVVGFGSLTGPIVGAIVIGSVVLAPAIVFGYGVKAAERDDREHGRTTMADESSDDAGPGAPDA